MAKVPVMGRVKTRLARQVGATEAMRFYRANVCHVANRLAADSRFDTILSVSPDAEYLNRSLPLAVNRIQQGSGDLGQRMQRLFDSAQPGPAVVIGTDIPAVDPQIIALAFRALGNHDAVFGPADDGGYWLVGLRRTTKVLKIFNNVRWSTETALADTLRNLHGRRVALIETLSDVDSAADLRAASQCVGRRILV
jgi:uncharacterized protein